MVTRSVSEGLFLTRSLAYASGCYFEKRGDMRLRIDRKISRTGFQPVFCKQTGWKPVLRPQMRQLYSTRLGMRLSILVPGLQPWNALHWRLLPPATSSRGRSLGSSVFRGRSLGTRTSQPLRVKYKSTARNAGGWGTTSNLTMPSSLHRRAGSGR